MSRRSTRSSPEEGPPSPANRQARPPRGRPDTASQATGSGGSAVGAAVMTGMAGVITALDNLIVTATLPSIRKDLGGGLAQKRGALPPA